MEVVDTLRREQDQRPVISKIRTFLHCNLSQFRVGRSWMKVVMSALLSVRQTLFWVRQSGATICYIF